MKRIIIFLLIIFAIDLQGFGEIFECTDIIFASTVPENTRNIEKKELLGEKIRVTYYDRSIRVEQTDNDGVPLNNIFDKIEKDKYQYKNNTNGNLFIIKFFRKDNKVISMDFINMSENKWHGTIYKYKLLDYSLLKPTIKMFPDGYK